MSSASSLILTGGVGYMTRKVYRTSSRTLTGGASYVTRLWWWGSLDISVYGMVFMVLMNF